MRITIIISDPNSFHNQNNINYSPLIEGRTITFENITELIANIKKDIENLEIALMD